MSLLPKMTGEELADLIRERLAYHSEKVVDRDGPPPDMDKEAKRWQWVHRQVVQELQWVLDVFQE